MESLPDDLKFPKVEDFPTSETEIIALGKKLIAAMINHPERFPAPPVSVAELSKSLDSFIAARNAETVAKIAAIQADVAVEKAYNALLEAERQYEKANGGKAASLWN